MKFDAWLRYHGARVMNATGQPERAIAWLREALRIDPGYGAAAAFLGYLLGEQGRHGEAADCFAAAITHRPDDAVLRFNHAYVLQLANRNEEAVEEFRLAVKGNPLLDRAWYGLGLSLNALHRREEAVTALAEAARLQPMSPYALYELGMTYHALGRGDDVRRILRQLEVFEPKAAAQLATATGSRQEPG